MKLNKIILIIAVGFLVLSGCAPKKKDNLDGLGQVETPPNDKQPSEPKPKPLEGKEVVGDYVEITMPRWFLNLGEDDIILNEEVLLENAGEDIEEVIIKPDGRIVYRMHKDKYQEMLDEFSGSVEEFIDEVVAEDNSIKSIVIDKNYANIEVKVDRQAYESGFDGIIVMALGLQVTFYQIFIADQTDLHPVIITVIDEATNEVISSKSVLDE